MLNVVSVTRPSLQILGKSQTGVFDFLISGQSLTKEICHNSRVTDDDIDMKLGPLFLKRNKSTLRKFDDDVMFANCDMIFIFLIYGQFGAIRKLDSGCRVCKTYIFINNLLSYKI